MDLVKGLAMIILAVFLFVGIPAGAAADGPEDNPAGMDGPIIWGRIEEVGADGLLVNGRYYYIDNDALITDGQNRLGREALTVGTDVELFMQGTTVMIITIHGAPGAETGE